jgi:hypothetical protein
MTPNSHYGDCASVVTSHSLLLHSSKSHHESSAFTPATDHAQSKRVAAAISVAPLLDSTGNPERRQPILELAMHDRASRLAGEEPMYLPYVNEDGSIPNGLQLDAEMMPALERLGIPVENRISVQTYYKSLSWNLLNVVQYISPTPAMMVTPEFDKSCPTADQLGCFEQMKEPKEFEGEGTSGLDLWRCGGDPDEAIGLFEEKYEILKSTVDFRKAG